MPESDRPTSDNARFAAASRNPHDPTVPLHCDPASDLMPDLEGDLEVLSWLACSPRLGGVVTGFLVDAFAGWALAGRGYPQVAVPDAGPECDHLQALEVIIARLPRRIIDADGVALKMDLGRLGRLLSRASWACWDPQAVRDSIERELTALLPWVAGPPAPSRFPDGGVL